MYVYDKDAHEATVRGVCADKFSPTAGGYVGRASNYHFQIALFHINSISRERIAHTKTPLQSRYKYGGSLPLHELP
jgi:hypothetical protein